MNYIFVDLVRIIIKFMLDVDLIVPNDVILSRLKVKSLKFFNLASGLFLLDKFKIVMIRSKKRKI